MHNKLSRSSILRSVCKNIHNLHDLTMMKGNNLCFPFGHLYVKVICHLKMRSVEQNLTKSLAKVKVTDGFQSLHSKRLSAVSGTINLETL